MDCTPWLSKTESLEPALVLDSYSHHDQVEGDDFIGRADAAINAKQNLVLTGLPSDIEDVIQNCEIIDEEDGKKELSVVVNDRLVKALDRVLLYLRVVHCVDYYNGKEYPLEDEMPSRCGIIHVRDAAPSNVCKKEVHEWCKQNAEKLQELLEDAHVASDVEAGKLGLKNTDDELENFVKANTQELAKDKWLCPLSGKKFRGPEFIRKHIFNKHQDSVENVKMEVQFFNNYVRDLKRPCFPEAKTRPPATGLGQPSATPMPSASPASAPDQRWTPRQAATFTTPHGAYSGGHIPAGAPSSSMHGSSTGPDTYGRMNTYPPKQQRRDFGSRPIIKYRDLDAPDEGDFF